MQYNAIVKNVKEITPEIKLFFINFKDGHKFNFKAGQFAVLALPDDKKNLDGEWHRRAYSITSAPSQDEVEFYIVLVKEGKLTPRLFELKAGDEIYMGEKPAGLMNFSGVEEDANLLFVSTGTGIAPFVSILREHKQEILNGKRQVALSMVQDILMNLVLRESLKNWRKNHHTSIITLLFQGQIRKLVLNGPDIRVMHNPLFQTEQ